MKKIEHFIFLNVAIPIDIPEPGVVYHCHDDRRIDFICPCGCGERIILNTHRESRPCWTVKDNTIIPSVNRIIGCLSHFNITNGLVSWS